MPDGLSSMQKPLILVVEDEAALATMLRYNLEKQGFRVDEAADGQEALTRIAEARPEIVLLDWMLPVMSGIEVCRQIRRKPATRDLPVIMVTARTEDADAVRALNTGADDYITKPFRPRELRARVEAMLRRPRMGMPDPADDATPGAQAAPAADASADDGWLLHRGLRVHPAMRIAEADGTELDLTRSEFDILADLMGAGRRVVSKSDLALMLRGERYVGGSDFVSDHDVRAIEVHVANLRRKLGESATQPRWIETIRGVGYRMTAAS